MTSVVADPCNVMATGCHCCCANCDKRVTHYEIMHQLPSSIELSRIFVYSILWLKSCSCQRFEQGGCLAYWVTCIKTGKKHLHKLFTNCFVLRWRRWSVHQNSLWWWDVDSPFTPESQHPRPWCSKKGGKAPQKAKEVESSNKVMVPVFWTAVEFYWWTICPLSYNNKHRMMLWSAEKATLLYPEQETHTPQYFAMEGLVSLWQRATTHCLCNSASLSNLVRRFKTSFLFSDLASSDFHLFLELKTHLGSQRLN